MERDGPGGQAHDIAPSPRHAGHARAGRLPETLDEQLEAALPLGCHDAFPISAALTSDATFKYRWSSSGLLTGFPGSSPKRRALRLTSRNSTPRRDCRRFPLGPEFGMSVDRYTAIDRALPHRVSLPTAIYG